MWSEQEKLAWTSFTLEQPRYCVFRCEKKICECGTSNECSGLVTGVALTALLALSGLSALFALRGLCNVHKHWYRTRPYEDSGLLDYQLRWKRTVVVPGLVSLLALVVAAVLFSIYGFPLAKQVLA